MKKNPYIIVLICTTVVIIAEFTSLQIILKTTRLFPKTEIVLQVKSDILEDSELPLTISEESLTELQNVITETTLNSNQDKLIEIFDKERNFYINFITIISIVLSVIGITPGIYAFFEKNENLKLREELDEIKNDYNKQLDLIKIHNVLSSINDIIEGMKKDTIFVMADSKPVSSLNDFEKFIQDYMVNSLKSINIDLMIDKFIQAFAINLHNLFDSIIIYSDKNFGTKLVGKPDTKYLINDISILKGICLQIRILLPEGKFDTIMEVFKSLPKDYYDFSGL